MLTFAKFFILNVLITDRNTGKFNYLVIVALIIIWLFHILLFNNLWIQPDSETYTQAARILAGDSDAPDRLFRLSKPLALFIPAVLYRLGIPIEWAFWAQQWGSYVVACWALYRWYRHLSNSSAVASFGVLMYASCQPVGVYGQAVLVDMLGWAVGILLLNVAWHWANLVRTTWLATVGLGATMGVCIFIKESTLIAGVWLFWLILVEHKWAWRQKLQFYTLLASSFVVVVAAGFGLTSFYFEKSIIDWIAFNHTDTPQYANWVIAFMLQTARTIDVYWILVLIGFLFFIKEKFNKIEKPLLALLLAAVSVWLCYPLVWKYMMDRILFMFAPFWLYWGAWWLARWGRNVGVLIIAATLSNLGATYLIYQYSIPYLLYFVYFLYLILILI